MIFDDKGLIGFDVSRWQRDATVTPPLEIDFSVMKSYGTDFVIMKAGQNNFTDPGFLYNWKAARDQGIPRGSYWFLDYRSTPQAQATYYWNLIKDDSGEGVHAADFEFGARHDLDFLYNFLSYFQQLSGLPNDRIAIYTSYYFFQEARANPSDPSPSPEQKQWFGKFPLWLAWYANNPSDVLVPYPWTMIPGQPVIWQDGTPDIGHEVGVRSEEVDHNRLNGGADILQRYFGAEPNEGEGEQPMANYYEVRSTNSAEYRTIRSGPRVTFTPVTTLPTGTTSMAKARVDDVYVYTADSYDGTALKAKAGDQWVHIFEVNGVARDGWVAVKHLGVVYTTLVLVVVTPPQQEYILHVKDGVSRKFILES